MRMKIASVTRSRNTASGNPVLRVEFDDGATALTEPDAAFVGALDEYALQGAAVDVALSPAGRITALDVVS